MKLIRLVKLAGKALLCQLLERQAVRLRQKHNFKVVAVAGSVGKTSTKLAIARTLESAGLKVRYQEGNYNDRLTVPLVLFGRELPGLFNVPAWFKILAANNRVIRQRYNYDVVVLEIGTDAPGQISQFAYLKPELAVVTSVAPEHMEYFGSLDAVAEEELSVFNFAKHVLINADDVPEAYLKRKKFFSYSVIDRDAEYYATGRNEDLWGQIIEIYTDGRSLMRQKTAFIGSQGRKIVLAAAAVADILKASRQDVSNAIAQLQPFAGRMQQLRGIKGSTILDDSYNATPSSVEAALAVLQHAKADMRIAILGSMNELGDFSAEAHKAVGVSIDPQKISLVVTIGEAANNYLAQAALQNKCQVATFTNPKKAGEFVKRHVTKDTVVLVKGSQNGVFSEEAIKPLLANKRDVSKLVRQSRYWMHRKKRTLSL